MIKIISLFTILFLTEAAYGQIRDSIGEDKFDSLVTSALKAGKDKVFDKALLFIDSAIGLNSTYDYAFIIKSEILWMQKRYAEAAENYNNAILLNKDTSFFFGAYLMLGILNEKAGLTERADVNYLKAVYLYENKKQLDRFYPDQDKEDYAVALCLSQNHKAWEQILKLPQYTDLLQKYFGKSRKEVLELYFKKYGG